MKETNRIWEIDFLRGIAILLMVVFHAVYDLRTFHSRPLDYLSGFWYYEGKLAAVLFMVISGVCSTIGRRNVRHGLEIFAWGMFLTVITYFYDAGSYIRFGILHLLGVSLMTAPLVRKMRPWLAVLASVPVLALGAFVPSIPVTSHYFLSVGLTYDSFYSVDYYPLLPWYGIFLLGTAAGNVLYARKRSLLGIEASRSGITRLGRHSLAVYLLHQPVLLALLWGWSRLFWQ
ncbi:Hypothetical protein LUCI_3630 [Lucifera butyrica]|uniref:Heparan-alpha-glucosaminide N-acetyltransferase catalytic domain-containing protein n=1 Tax=Lucifera butyrica TaxID=1351585 RepID=A0A498RGV2_9FIRM|nr:heparan-alpha-glucosaminide N-acetyltransferase [Lucifera butyrica]VBB08358.1 Hypothetical protein LUCI_3630 [Lucifera butyrica]